METSAALRVGSKCLCSAARTRGTLSAAASHVYSPASSVRAFSFDSLTTRRHSRSPHSSYFHARLHFSRLPSTMFFRDCSALYSTAAGTMLSSCFLPALSRTTSFVQPSLRAVSSSRTCSSFPSSSSQLIPLASVSRSQPTGLTYVTHAATKRRAAFIDACGAATSTRHTLPAPAGRDPFTLQTGDAARVAEKIVAAATVKGAGAAAARGNVDAAERKASAAGEKTAFAATTAEAAVSPLHQAAAGATKQDHAASGGEGGFGSSSAAGLVAATATVASPAGFNKKASWSEVSPAARFAGAGIAESAAARTVKATSATGKVEAALVSIGSSSVAGTQHTALTGHNVPTRQASRSMHIIKQISGSPHALRHLRRYRSSLLSLGMPSCRAATASYSVAVAATSRTAARVKFPSFTRQQSGFSLHTAACAFADASTAGDKPRTAFSDALAGASIFAPLETSLATAATNSTTRLFYPYCTTVADTATTTPRLPITAAPALSSLPTGFPVADPVLSSSRGNLFTPAATGRSRSSLTATSAPSVSTGVYCSFSFPRLQASALRVWPSSAVAAFLSASSSLPAADVSLPLLVTVSKMAAAPVSQSPDLTAYNLTPGVTVTHAACFFDVATCANSLHRTAASASTEHDLASNCSVEKHTIFLYPSREGTCENPFFARANSIGGNKVSGHTQVERGDTHWRSERMRPKQLLLDPHVQQPVEQQLQQHTQRHSSLNLDCNEQISHCIVEQLTQQHLMQKRRQDNVQRPEQPDICSGLQQPEKGTITLRATTLSENGTASRCNRFADPETSASCPSRTSNAPLGRADYVETPEWTVPMLLRWRPKKSFKKKTMNLPSTKARRRWARLRR